MCCPDAASGGYAEYSTASAGVIAKKPEGVSHEEAAAIPVAGLTAWQALFDRGGLVSGQSALVAGAAGGVGHFAVQFAPPEKAARARGARRVARDEPEARAARADSRACRKRRCARGIAEAMPLADVKRAHELSESGHVRGKLVLTVAT